MIARYCTDCGTALLTKELAEEGRIPYCPHCETFRFPTFSNAVQVVLFTPDQKKVLLIKQYGRDRYILPAGYVSLGEGIEETVRREIKEELGCELLSASYGYSTYWQKSDTLMFVFAAVSATEQLVTNSEVDAYKWCDFEEAKQLVLKASLAERSLLWGLEQKSRA